MPPLTAEALVLRTYKRRSGSASGVSEMDRGKARRPPHVQVRDRDSPGARAVDRFLLRTSRRRAGAGELNYAETVRIARLGRPRACLQPLLPETTTPGGGTPSDEGCSGSAVRYSIPVLRHGWQRSGALRRMRLLRWQGVYRRLARSRDALAFVDGTRQSHRPAPAGSARPSVLRESH